MGTVELTLYPPLTRRLFPRRKGVQTLTLNLRQDDTLGNVLDRLAAANAEGWDGIYETRTRAVKPVIVVLHNGTGVPSATAAETPLADGDRITLRLVYGGG